VKKGAFMKCLAAKRVKIRIGDLWESPVLSILLSDEDGVVVARCLDFTVSSHGENEDDAVASLADAIKEYVLTAVEAETIHSLYDPARQKFWRAFHDIDQQQSIALLNNSITLPLKNEDLQAINRTAPELIYA
jgi:hypothetical protein